MKYILVVLHGYVVFVAADAGYDVVAELNLYMIAALLRGRQ